MPYSEEVGKLWEETRSRIGKRINNNRHAFDKLGLKSFYIAGGALLPAEPNDYDLFPVGEKDFDKLFNSYMSRRTNPYTGNPISSIGDLVWETPNALTINSNGIKIQLCKFWNESLIKTVERFDFTHCKLGAHIIKRNNVSPSFFVVDDVYLSDEFVRFRILGYSEYCGIQEDDFPLSSLLRVFKYIKKGYIRSTYDVIFKILEAFLERGYKDELDFKTQLLGIDVGVEEAEQLDANSKSLKHIYYLLTGKTIKDDKLFETNMMIGDNSV